jgi:hypothetical protein
MGPPPVFLVPLERPSNEEGCSKAIAMEELLNLEYL